MTLFYVHHLCRVIMSCRRLQKAMKCQQQWKLTITITDMSEHNSHVNGEVTVLQQRAQSLSILCTSENNLGLIKDDHTSGRNRRFHGRRLFTLYLPYS